MASYVTEKVFERKHTKLKSFIVLTIKYGIGLCVLAGAMILLALNSGKDNPMEFILEYGWLFLAVAVVGIIINTAKEKDVSVTVLSKSVDITVGDANAVYSVKDYIGTNFNHSGKGKARYELVFADNDNDPDTNLYVGLPGIKIKQFKEISDAVMIAKQELTGDIEYEAFEGDVYERNKPSSFDLKLILLTIVVAAVTILFFVLFFNWLVLNKLDIAPFVLGMAVLVFFYVFILSKLIAYIFERENGVKDLKSLKFETSSLKINDETFSLKDIETISMTPPYVMDLSRYHRILSVKLYESKKPLKFSLGNRIEKEENEETLAEGCTCTYPALYERIKTGRETSAKFKI